MRAVFIVAVGFSLFISVGFFAVGAWPVLGFFGLDILGLYWAFHIVRKRAERRFKRMDANGDGLISKDELKQRRDRAERVKDRASKDN